MRYKLILVLLLLCIPMSSAKEVTEYPNRNVSIYKDLPDYYLKYIINGDGEEPSLSRNQLRVYDFKPGSDICSYESKKPVGSQLTYIDLDWSLEDTKIEIISLLRDKLDYAERVDRWNDGNYAYDLDGDNPYICYGIILSLYFLDWTYLDLPYFTLKVYRDEINVKLENSQSFLSGLNYTNYFIIPLILLPLTRTQYLRRRS